MLNRSQCSLVQSLWLIQPCSVVQFIWVLCNVLQRSCHTVWRCTDLSHNLFNVFISIYHYHSVLWRWQIDLRKTTTRASTVLNRASSCVGRMEIWSTAVTLLSAWLQESSFIFKRCPAGFARVKFWDRQREERERFSAYPAQRCESYHANKPTSHYLRQGTFSPQLTYSIPWCTSVRQDSEIPSSPRCGPYKRFLISRAYMGIISHTVKIQFDKLSIFLLPHTVSLLVSQTTKQQEHTW